MNKKKFFSFLRSPSSRKRIVKEGGDQVDLMFSLDKHATMVIENIGSNNIFYLANQDSFENIFKASVVIKMFRRDGTMARVLMSIVIVFLSCHSPKIVVNFYEALQVK